MVDGEDEINITKAIKFNKKSILKNEIDSLPIAWAQNNGSRDLHDNFVVPLTGILKEISESN